MHVVRNVLSMSLAATDCVSTVSSLYSISSAMEAMIGNEKRGEV